MLFIQTVFTVFCLALYGVAYSAEGRLFQIITVEDNFGEFLQMTLLLCSIQFLWRARKIVGRLKPLAYVAMLGLFFVAGEEISWGQRLVSWSWPWLQHLNTQDETNLHNILPLHGKIGPYMVATFLLCGIGPLLLAALSRPLMLSFGKIAVIDSICAGALMMSMYVGLNPAAHIYFYEFTELWIYGIFLLQLRLLFRNVVEPPPIAPYVFAAMALSLWMQTPLYSGVFGF